VDEAYELAWLEFKSWRELTSNEKKEGPRNIRSYIEAIVSSGVREPKQVAAAALGMMRQYQQILRSRASIEQRTPMNA
jgi:hypothetical protein